MSHITIIISRSRQFSSVAEAANQEPELSYNYEMPVPHDATPQQVGEMVRKAFKRLEAVDD